MQLFYREAGEGDPLLIVHGLFGSSDNWMTLAKKYSDFFRVIVVDMRNHGQSPHDDVFNYDVMSDDLLTLLDKLEIQKVNIIGHSMGGKVAMKFSVRYPQRVAKLIVADIAPRQYPVHHNHIISALRSLDLSSLKSRNEADLILAKQINGAGERQFLLKNLKRTSKGFEWKMALDVISENIVEVGQGLLPEESATMETLFIRGGNSDYISETDLSGIEQHFKNSSLVTINNAGHWLHAEQPAQFFKVSLDFLQKR